MHFKNTPGFYNIILAGFLIAALLGAAATPAAGIPSLSIALDDGDAINAGVTVTPTSGLVTTEARDEANFTVVLDTQPTGNVEINLVSSDTTEGTVSTDSITFTGSNWDDPQTVTVTGEDDFFDDGDKSYTILVTIGFTSDPGYAEIDPDDVSVTNLDDDVSSLVLNPAAGLTTNEGGSQDTFTVELGSLPAGNVVLDLASTDATEGTVSPATMTFTSGNWSAPQTATVTGVNDILDDGNVAYSIEVAVDPAQTVDGNYKTIPPAYAQVVNSNASPGFSIKPLAGLVTSEGGMPVTLKIYLKTKPADTVFMEFSSNKPDEGKVSKASLTVTPGNWVPAPYEVVVSGVDDLIPDGDIPYQVKLTTESEDPDYAGFGDGTGELNLGFTNLDAPTIVWEFPPLVNGIYETDNLSPILLRVGNAGTEPIDIVRFNYWDPVAKMYVLIGEDSTDPYEATLSNIDELPLGEYTQVFVSAYDDPDGTGPKLSRGSVALRALILRRGEFFRVYLSFIQ